MSGLVAILSPDPQVLGRGPDALGRLRHLDEFETQDVRLPGAYVGVCGRAREISLARQDGGHPEGFPGDTGPTATRVAAVAGEVFNLAALRRDLALASDASAAAVALAASERWGDDLLTHLEGHFAVVVHDDRTGRTFAAPDTYGVSYLHTLRLGDDVLIATEARAFMADPRFRPRLDREATSCVVALGHEFGRGLFAGVDAVPQGHFVAVDDGAPRMVRHWDARDAVGGLSGDAYVQRLRETIEVVAAEVFAGGRSLLPLTGGLDSRLLAAARPPGAEIEAFTFGDMSDSDCLRGSQIARAAGLPHFAVPFEPDYVARHAAQTIWLTEGRLTPVENTTGLQMPALTASRQFVSGVDCGLGRRFSKAKTVIPDHTLTGPDNPALDAWLHLRFSRSGMSPEETATVFGRRAGEAREPGIEALARYLEESRGFTGVDRIDLYFVGGRARGWRTSGLGLAGTWIPPRAPFFTRRWIEAVLSGAPGERLDDLARLRLIRQLDPAVARVPWVMTRLPLSASEHILVAAREAARLRVVGRGGAKTTSRTRSATSSANEDGPSAQRQALTRRYMATVKGAYHRIYTYGDHRDEWLRGPSRAYAEQILLSPRLADHDLADAAGVRRLLGDHMAGKDHTLALSILLGLELWVRLFVDGDPAPRIPPRQTG